MQKWSLHDLESLAEKCKIPLTTTNGKKKTAGTLLNDLKAFSKKKRTQPKKHIKPDHSSGRVRPLFPLDTKFKLIDVPADGSCFYYAYITALLGRKISKKSLCEYNLKLRAKALRYFKTHPELHAFLGEDDNLAEEMKRFSADKEWAHELQVMTTALATKSNIIVLRTGGKTIYDHVNKVFTWKEISKTFRFKKPPYYSINQVLGKHTIVLVNNADNHFLSLIPC